MTTKCHIVTIPPAKLYIHRSISWLRWWYVQASHRDVHTHTPSSESWRMSQSFLFIASRLLIVHYTTKNFSIHQSFSSCHLFVMSVLSHNFPCFISNNPIFALLRTIYSRHLLLPSTPLIYLSHYWCASWSQMDSMYLPPYMVVMVSLYVYSWAEIYANCWSPGCILSINDGLVFMNLHKGLRSNLRFMSTIYKQIY